MSAPHVLIRIGGEGGEGIISTGDLLSRAASRQGLCIMTYRTYPAEIKGGLAQFQMKLASDPIRSIGLRFQHLMAFNQEALDAFHRLSRLEGIIPALESAHAVAYVLDHGGGLAGAGPILICLSGRGDKDVAHVARLEGRGSLL